MNAQLAQQILDTLPELHLRQVYKFGVHARKGPWNRVTINEAVKHLMDEVDELMSALEDADTTYEEIADECADIANMAAIIMSNFKRGARIVRT